ncbi:MAG: 4Fe-4S binding protein [Firmicutes bacterium]|nr:4Fe-4S binding protein [Bacillota bacterium]
MNKKKLEQIKEQYKPIIEEKRAKWQEEHDTPFYTRQTRLVLRNVEIIEPTSVHEYIATDGYFGFAKALTMQPQEIIDIVKESGMRGRGGAGFSTGKKWQFVHDAQSETKYIVCNADEGDPGAFMDRAILENDPYSVLESMTIAGYALGAQKGYIYCRAEYPQAVKNCKAAIIAARKNRLLGDNLFGTNFSFNIELRLGAGAFVCGEETALIASIEGKRGEPRPRPPFPAVSGLYGKPTLINNVETLSAIPMIIFEGAERWNKIGSPNNAGTKVFALAGNITNGGLIEVPMGITIKEIIYEIGGGYAEGSKVKAVQAGGPSGGCIPASMFDLPIDFDSLQSVGSILGSGGLVVMCDKVCMIDVAKFFIKFSVDESCGKCVPCRIGNIKLLNILEKITSGRGEESDLCELEKLSKTIIETSLCGLGQSSPNPVLSTLTHFREEYLDHIHNRRCGAGICRELTTYEINEKCIMCTACIKVCPVDAITGELKKPHYLSKEKCIKCNKCVPICPVDAIVRV